MDCALRAISIQTRYAMVYGLDLDDISRENGAFETGFTSSRSLCSRADDCVSTHGNGGSLVHTLRVRFKLELDRGELGFDRVCFLGSIAHLGGDCLLILVSHRVQCANISLQGALGLEQFDLDLEERALQCGQDCL